MSNSDTAHHSTSRLLPLVIGSLGVVYGDIGTSPLYAFRESLAHHEGVTVNPTSVLGVMSLIFWSLVIVIAIKYLAFVLRADLKGEGGILALTALIRPERGKARRGRYVLILIGLFGTALLYGDGMITPAISVLSAVEGFSIATDALTPFVIPVSIAILIAIFSVQRRGTGAVGAIFGRIMVVWFLVLGVLGGWAIMHEPGVFAAVNPAYGVRFFVENGFPGFLVLGSVFLVVTGGEALYADMGHFGRRPITIGWFSFVMPMLLLNYFGQAALLLRDPGAIENPFYFLAPGWATIPLAILATMATVIASQALISGSFSLTQQAVQLNYLPRVRVKNTSGEHRGQIFIPSVNRVLMFACIALVLGFRSSSNLAAAYGVAVTLTMVVTTLLFYFVAREKFGWSRAVAVPVCGVLLAIDLAFFGANAFKIPDGGWFPLVVGAVIFIGMTTWKRGRELLTARLRAGELDVDRFLRELDPEDPRRIPGTAVYLYSQPDKVPPSLLANMRHNGVLPERVVLVTVVMDAKPHVHPAKRVQLTPLDRGFVRIVVTYGYQDRINVPEALRSTVGKKIAIDPDRVTYVVGRERVKATNLPGMAIWRERLFAFMLRNSTDVARYFHLPPDRTMEVGQRVEI